VDDDTKERKKAVVCARYKKKKKKKKKTHRKYNPQNVPCHGTATLTCSGVPFTSY
jgi:hypothetical protein